MKSLKDTLTKKRELSLADKEALVEDKKETSKNLHRLTLDLPPWLVEKIKAETERNGQTMRGLILTMLLERFK
jgi:hypothetical protein